MPQASTVALVLAAAPLNEQDKLVSLLTAERGVLKAVAPGAAKLANRFGSLLELFTEGDFHYYWREDRELATLSRGEIRQSHFSLVTAPGNIFYFCFLAEIVLKSLPPGNHDTRVFKLLKAVLAEREAGLDMGWLVLYFLTWFLRSEGLLFNPRRCSSCGARGFAEAWLRDDYRGLLCPSCRRSERLRLDGDELEFIAWTAGQPPQGSAAWSGRFAPAGLMRILTGTLEHHGEFSLQSRRYLPEFR